MSTLKIFPFFIIAYTFKKYEVVITPELIHYTLNMSRREKAAKRATHKYSMEGMEFRIIHIP